MTACSQSSTQNVLQHGYAVHLEYERIINQIKKKDFACLPEWISVYVAEILTELERFNPQQIEDYHIYHDCGKPFCRTLDQEGKQHFPNHANVSSTIYYTLTKDKIVSSWIQHDMDIHLLSSSDIPEFCKLEGAVVLLLTGLSELFANANLFGGTDSTSFKIKYKHLNRRGKAICTYLWGRHV